MFDLNDALKKSNETGGNQKGKKKRGESPGVNLTPEVLQAARQIIEQEQKSKEEEAKKKAEEEKKQAEEEAREAKRRKLEV